MLNVSEDLLHSSRYDPSLRITLLILEPFHCVGFASSCLSVGQYSCVVAL
jgi:hypothetical protein